MEATEPTFLFADLAGFTALTEVHGDQDAADLAERFCVAVTAMLPPSGAEVVKTIGDAVMARFADPAAAVGVALRIAHETGEQPGFPSIRVGLHTGPAVERDGDWFGAAVNTAARISALARGGEVLLSDATRAAAGAPDGVEFAEHGRHELRNVAEPVVVHRALRTGAARGSLPIDPVCRMVVDPTHSAGALVHSGTEYHFCSYDCVRAFAADPERHVGGSEEVTERRAARAARLLAGVQGASYVCFGMWSLARRDHYRRVHDVRADDWLLNAHAGWLAVVGATLLGSALAPGRQGPEVRALGGGSAVALAANDVALRDRLPPIYGVDLAYEVILAGAWAATTL